MQKEILFDFQVTKEPSLVTEGIQICLPTTWKILGIPRCFGQALNAALLCKEEAATKALSTVAETKYPGSSSYWYFSNNLIVPVLPTSAKARKIVGALKGHIIHLSKESLNAIDNIGKYQKT